MTGPDGHRLTAATATRSSSRPSTIVTFSGWTHWSPLRRRHQRRGPRPCDAPALSTTWCSPRRLTGARFERVNLQGATFAQVSLNDARIHAVD
ncbi:pentapeptide repeat-containing protein, partial [Streptomyces sp. NPDC005146]